MHGPPPQLRRPTPGRPSRPAARSPRSAAWAALVALLALPAAPGLADARLAPAASEPARPTLRETPPPAEPTPSRIPATSPPATPPPAEPARPTLRETPPPPAEPTPSRISATSPPATSPPAETSPPAAPTTPPSPETTTPGPSQPDDPDAATPPLAEPSPAPRTGPRAVPRRAPPPAATGEIPPEPPRDPDDAPFMRPPNNQPKPTRMRTSPDLRRGYSSVRRVALTIAPLFASLRLPFLCRPTCSTSYDKPERRHGAGFGGEVDVQIIRWLWFRAQGSYSVHPVGDERVTDDAKNITVVAPAGTIRALGFGVGPVVALDLGRFLPLIEGGIGGLRVATPPGVRSGQYGEACTEKRTCDVGLTCGPANTCQQSVIPELYFGGAIDILVRRHLSLGAQFRYHALLTAPGKFPVYLVGGLRLGIRF